MAKGKKKPKKKEKRTTAAQRRMLEALKKSLGVVTHACDMAGIARKTHYRWIETDPAYARQVEDLKEQQVDFVKSKMLEGINRLDSRLIKFYLATQDPSYRETQELQVRGKGVRITFDGKQVPWGSDQDEEEDQNENG